ncbi:MAG: hypothetical protein VR74_05220 [Hyphomonas sp. BRH_c22]|uniref:MobC family plasmid mobilization relaxosome protein n=1 Tax=Hyphomonas sp. BRH_c22 TaxID=1629710 RepID=UPI0005F111F3|nr:MobC family plasmid mobilization relaxosome protein [Hyphomonas sp. BRH_c22]KJS38572.1 MAG: hypothetical protein VR74_05220 [Hyphomonas sp. BRH_c22]
MPRKGYRKPDAEARRSILRVYLTPAERAHIDSCVARLGGMTLADFVRRRVMSYPVPRARTADEAELIRALQKVGTNLNQLARSVNTGHAIEPTGFQAAIDELRSALSKIAIGR